RALARLQRYIDGDGFRALRKALALVDVEHSDVRHQRSLGALRSLQDVAGAHVRVDHEGEVAFDRHEIRTLEPRLGLGEFRLRRGHGVENDLEGDDRPLGVERLAYAWMQLPEPADDILRPKLQRRGMPWMEKGGTAGRDLHCIGDAERR